MSFERLEEDERVAAGGTLGARHFIVIAVVAIILVGVYIWNSTRDRAPRPPTPTVDRVEVPEGSRTITLYFAADDDPVLVGEARQVAMGRNVDEQTGQVLRALLSGPKRAGASTIPAETRVINTYFDSDDFVLFVDFSAELVGAHPGGTAAEYATVLAIMRTISDNFPEIRRVQFLVEGAQVGTLAGHVNINEPLRVEEWR